MPTHPAKKKFYKSNQWQFARMEALRRDEFMCTKCGDPADEVHHIIHLTPDNLLDPAVTLALDNLTSLCRDCHMREHDDDRRDKLRDWNKSRGQTATGGDYIFDSSGMLVPAAKRAILVTGAPASGKTTYIRKHMSVGDLVVDMDFISAALSLQNFRVLPKELINTVLEVRETLLTLVSERKGDWATAWVSATLPDHRKREFMIKRLRAEHVFIDATREECRARVQRDGTRKDKQKQLAIIDKWFSEYEKSF